MESLNWSTELLHHIHTVQLLLRRYWLQQQQNQENSDDKNIQFHFVSYSGYRQSKFRKHM